MIRKLMGVQWDELLRSGAAVDDRRAACAHCIRHGNRALTPWEMAFCNKIAGYAGIPQSKQQAILRVLFDRVLAATARAA